VAGDLGKATSIPSFDIEIVGYVNNQEPYFKEVLKDWEATLLRSAKFRVEKVHTTEQSVQCKVVLFGADVQGITANGFDFSIFPAANFVTSKGSGSIIEKNFFEQSRNVISKIRSIYSKDKHLVAAYNSSLAEYHVYAMRKQSVAAHELVRLCKFWIKTLFFGVDGEDTRRNTMVELIAVHVANEYTKRNSSPSILRSFEDFLKQIQNFEDMFIRHFIPPSVGTFAEVPEDIAKKPMVLEPGNPFNNYAAGWDKEIVGQFKAYAAETLSRLKNIYGSAYKLKYLPLETLFEPQPTVVKIGPWQARGVAAVGILPVTESRALTHPVALTSEVSDSDEFKPLQKLLENSLATTVFALTSSGRKDATEEDVVTHVKILLERQAFADTSKDWTSKGFDPKRADVSYLIPFTLDGKRKVVWACVTWAVSAHR
jgi:hypothetical protein